MALDGRPEAVTEEAKAQEMAGDQSSLPPICGSEPQLVELGVPQDSPVSVRLGSPLSDGQLNMLERLEDLIYYFLRAHNVGFDELGRAAEKLANLCTVSFDLGSFGDVDHSDISSFLQSVSSSVDPLWF